MRTISILTLALLACFCATIQAQDTKNMKVLAKSIGIWTPFPEVVVDKKTKKKTAEWESTENNSWHEDMGFIDNVPTVKNIDDIFPEMPNIHVDGPYSPMPWVLSEENGETVLHCYMRMPCDILTNMWLVSDECVILDKKTGIIYQSRRTVPDCYGKVFSVKAKEDQILDFQIFFSKLPETTREVTIYGVPNWHLRGYDVTLQQFPKINTSSTNAYDNTPQFHQAHLVSTAKNFNRDNHQSWAVYDDAHLIHPVQEGTMAIWRTPEATYLAIAYEMNWMREYFGTGGDNILIDQSGHQYRCKGVLGYPNDSIFWVEGCSGDYFAILQVFEPIPLHVRTITYIEPEGEPFAMWGASWDGKVVANLDIKKLLANQHLFKYQARVVVK